MRLRTKHVLLGVVGWLLTALCAFGQASGTISGQVFTMQGRPAAFAPIRVCANTSTGTPCTPTASIFSDSGLTQPLPNPTTADQYGNYSIFVAVGVYLVQITPAAGTTYTYLVSVASGSGGGGGGSVLQAPQYRIYIQPNPGTNAIAGPAPTTGNAVAPLMQGFYNTDLFTSGSGNNGLGNLEAGSCSGGGCTPMFPATSTSTESSLPKVGNTHVQDYRGGSQADYFYNPSSSGAAGYNPSGARPGAAKALILNVDQSQITSGGQGFLGVNEVENFNQPGWSWGTVTGQVGFSDWSAVKGRVFAMSVSSPGIAQYSGGQFFKYSVGDSALQYQYNHCDASFTAGSDEGCDGYIAQVLQNTTWFQGSVGAGATTGTQALPTSYISSASARPQFSVGGYMLDVTRPLLTNAHVTGPSVQMPNNGPWAFPVDATVTESTAWGYANANIPAPANPTQASTDTIAFTVTGGTNAGGFTTGKAWLDGAALPEQVMITAVGAISGGVQTVTFTHFYPNPAQGASVQTMLFQGGTNGFYDATAVASGTTYGGMPTAYTIFGATDSSHLVGRFSTGGSNLAIPSFYNSGTTNVQLLNLSVSGTTVTASCNCGSTAWVFNGLASAVISNATNSAFNGTVSGVRAINNNQLQWTQTVTGTSAQAYISYAPTAYAFSLFPGARVVQPATSAAPTVALLEPNDVAWTFNDLIQNIQQPSYRGTLIGGLNEIISPDSQDQAGLALAGFGVTGAGISGLYKYFSVNNTNNANMYQGDGGLLKPPLGMLFSGPIGTAFELTVAPIDRSPVISIGCAIDGCNSTNDINILLINNAAGKMSYTPSANQFYLNSLGTPTIQATVLSTGDGSYLNGGVTGGAQVALTAASAVTHNLYPSLGSYGMFGNKTLLDTSADVAAHTYYAGTIHAGALPPTAIGVATGGTPGSSTYSYVAISNTQNGHSVQSATATTTVGNATLNSTNTNSPQFVLGKGAQSTDIYRTAAPAGYALGRICTAVDNQSLAGNGDAPCIDSGQATTGSLPSNVDTSGTIYSANATIGNLTVTGTCTGCGSGGGIGSITWSLPSWLAASPTTLSGSGTQTFAAATGQPANQFLATPDGVTGAVGLRTIVPDDLPVGSASAFGVFKCDNTTITCAGGVLTAVGGGGGMVYPSGSGIPVVVSGSSWGTTVAAPAGTIVGTTDTQTLTNKTLDGVTPTMMGYLDATSSIQTQLNAKAPLASPTFTGTVTLPVTGSTQCLHVNSAGVVSGTGSDCGSSSGGITGSGTTGYYGLWTGTTAMGNGHLDDGVTTASTITSTEPIVAPSYGTSGTTNGYFDLTATGTAPGAAPANAVQVEAPSSVTAYRIELPGAAPTSGNTYLSCTAASPSVCSWAAGGGGSGTVTSVGFTGGLISVATATTTPAFTVAGTSGGVPYFSSASTWASSSVLTANVLTKGGGAGNAPGNSSITDNGTTVTSTDSGGFVGTTFTANGTTAGFVDLPQGTTSAAVAPCNVANSICFQAPAAVTSQLRTFAGTPATGYSYWTNTSGSMVETIVPVPTRQLYWNTQPTLFATSTVLGPIFHQTTASTILTVTAQLTGTISCTAAPTVALLDLGTSVTTAYGSATVLTSLATGTSDGAFASTGLSVAVAAGHYIGVGYSAGTCATAPTIDVTAEVQ